MASPTPIPTNLKVLRGTARPCRLNEKEPTPKKPEKIKPPSCLSKEEKKCWREIVSELQKCGIATTVDKSALTAYCKCWVAWKNELVIIDEEGTVVAGCMGNKIVSPHVRIASDYFKQLLNLWREFGMTPSSRSRIHANKDEPDDDFEAWQKKQMDKRRMAREGV